MDPPRRSTRKRRATAMLVAAPATPPKPPPKKIKTPVPLPAPAEAAPSGYNPSHHTVFLQSNLTALAWTPQQAYPRGAVPIKKLQHADAATLNEYFVSRPAARHAAQTSGAFRMFRHVGTALIEGAKPKKQCLEELAKFGKASLRHKSQLETVNARMVLSCVSCLNAATRDCLLRLSDPSDIPWPTPGIVITMSRKSLTNLSSRGSNIVVDVYLGRLIFELISCPDIKKLFQFLKPSVPFEPIPRLPNCEPSFHRSPDLCGGNTCTFPSVLRRAESVGYRSLNAQQKRIIERDIAVTLYPYQKQTVRWMLDKENDSHSLNDYFWEERSFTGTTPGGNAHFYYFPLAGELRLSRPPPTRGGMITEEMGLGKTVMAVALIAAQRRVAKPIELSLELDHKVPSATIRDGFIQLGKSRLQNQDTYNQRPCPLRHGDVVLSGDINGPFPRTVNVRRWPARTTLVVCPASLISQWAEEAQQRAPSLSLVVWDSEKQDAELVVGPDTVDVVVATYEQLRKDHLLAKVHWRRLILDEAQVTRRSSTFVARDTFNLRADSRFLMTGTPIVNSLDDLKGELAFLKVWPFTLERDGFWEAHILAPFKSGRGTALLDSLLQATMIRHSKSQNLGIKLPPRSYETIEVDLIGSHRACYCFVLACCLEELKLLVQHNRQSDTRRLRTLLKLLVALCVSPRLLHTTALDLARRSIWARRQQYDAVNSAPSTGSSRTLMLRQLSATDALEFLAESGSGIVRDSRRSYATNHANLTNVLEQYVQMPLDVLRAEVVSRGLLSLDRAEDTGRARLAALAAGGIHRLATDTVLELREAAIDAGLVHPSEGLCLSRSKAMILLHDHYNILSGITATRSIHESGFTALTKLIEKKERPGCPVCLGSCEDRISLTKCGHFYCVECVLLLFDNSRNQPKCAICRRDISLGTTIEVTIPRQGSQCERAEVEEKQASETEATEQAIDCPKRKELRGTRGKSGRTSKKSSTSRARTSPGAHMLPEDAWNEYRLLGAAPDRFNHLGRSPATPSLDPAFLRHLAASMMTGADPPKLAALLSLIQSRPEQTKFCVVAESTMTLRAIYEYLNCYDVKCVGFGVPYDGSNAHLTKNAAQQFATNPKVRVFLLNTANAAGLTLTAAEYCVFVETLQRATDELQASARVHRIGQKNAVKIVRIVARNSIEEQIMQQRGEITSIAEESRVLAMANIETASDEQVINLFRDTSGG